MVARINILTAIAVCLAGGFTPVALALPSGAGTAQHYFDRRIQRLEKHIEAAAKSGRATVARIDRMLDELDRIKRLRDSILADGTATRQERASFRFAVNLLAMELAECRFGARDPELLAEGDPVWPLKRKKKLGVTVGEPGTATVGAH